jgi:hypothetical protein
MPLLAVDDAEASGEGETVTTLMETVVGVRAGEEERGRVKDAWRLAFGVWRHRRVIEIVVMMVSEVELVANGFFGEGWGDG